MDAKEKLIHGLRMVAEAGIQEKCIDYILNVNRGQDEVMLHPDSRKAIQITMDLYSHLVNSKSPIAVKTLNVNPENVSKVYFHALGDTMVIGVLTSQRPNDIEVEHVK